MKNLDKVLNISQTLIPTI